MPSWSPDPPALARLWRIALRTALALVGLLFALLVYGSIVEPRLILDVEEEMVSLPRLPPEWEGRRIAVMGDFQVGMWGANTGMMRRAVERAIVGRPAAVLLTGDFIYHSGDDPDEEIDVVVEILSPLMKSGIPTFAVLGNHDWGLRTRSDTLANRTAVRSLEAALERMGIHLLRSEATRLQAEGMREPLYIAGIGSHWAENDDPMKALEAVPEAAARIVLMHHPDSFAAIPADAAPLSVAGHTHGGQIRIPFAPAWSWLTFTSRDEVHADGWIDGYGEAGNRLYVNRGIGMSTLPIRINCPPELTLFTLVR